jgi:hypothetical protein
MGYTTDFVGHIDVHPPLNDAEVAYLSGFHRTRRYDRPEGPYYVPPNPFAQERRVGDIERYNRPAPGQPELWCRWVPCWDGCCLALDGEERIYAPERWLEYLARHFLAPGAEASHSGLSEFEDFSFDHVLEGLVVGSRRDTRELFAMRVEDNVVTQEVLWPPDVRYVGYPPLPYEEVIDRDRAWSRKRKSSGRGGLRSLE